MMCIRAQGGGGHNKKFIHIIIKLVNTNICIDLARVGKRTEEGTYLH